VPCEQLTSLVRLDLANTLVEGLQSGFKGVGGDPESVRPKNGLRGKSSSPVIERSLRNGRAIGCTRVQVATISVTARIIASIPPGFSIHGTPSSSGTAMLSQTDTEAILKAEIENGGMRLPVFEGAQRFTTIADRPDHAKAFVSKNLGDHQSDTRLVLNDQNTLPTIFLHRLAPPNFAGTMIRECEPIVTVAAHLMPIRWGRCALFAWMRAFHGSGGQPRVRRRARKLASMVMSACGVGGS
jgi:hypothetical protein